MTFENVPELGNPSVDIGEDFSTICLDGKLYDLDKARELLSGFPEIRCLDDESGSLVIFIDEKDRELLRENTLNLCNLLFENSFRVR